MRNKESFGDKSKHRIFGRQSVNHRLRQAHLTCCTKMHATGKVISRYSSGLTLYTQTSVCIFSILFSIHFLGCSKKKFGEQSRTSLVWDQFHYLHDLNEWLRGYAMKKITSQSLLGLKRFLIYLFLTHDTLLWQRANTWNGNFKSLLQWPI